MRSALALALTIAACSPASMVENPPRISHPRAGECWYTPGHWCSPDKPCDTPAAVAIDCPPAMRPAAASTAVDDWRPPSRRHWVRVRQRLIVGPTSCGLYADHYCAPPDHPTRTDCDAPDYRQIPCTHTHTGARIVPFIVREQSGRCIAFPAIDCPLGECALPPGQPTDCR